MKSEKKRNHQIFSAGDRLPGVMRIDPIKKAIKMVHSENDDIRVFLSSCCLELRQSLRDKVIIRIEEEEIFSCGVGNSRITGSSLTEIFPVPDDVNSGIFRRNLEKYFHASVGRKIINKQNFKILKCLPGETAVTAPQILFCIVNRNDDGNERFYTCIIYHICRPKSAMHSPRNAI